MGPIFFKGIKLDANGAGKFEFIVEEHLVFPSQMISLQQFTRCCHVQSNPCCVTCRKFSMLDLQEILLDNVF